MVAGAQERWSVEEVATLRRKWAEGLDRVRIADEMHRTVEGVASKARKIGLRGRWAPARPKPPAQARPAGRVTLPPLSSLLAADFEGDER